MSDTTTTTENPALTIDISGLFTRPTGLWCIEVTSKVAHGYLHTETNEEGEFVRLFVSAAKRTAFVSASREGLEQAARLQREASPEWVFSVIDWTHGVDVSAPWPTAAEARESEHNYMAEKAACRKCGTGERSAAILCADCLTASTSAPEAVTVPPIPDEVKALYQDAQARDRLALEARIIWAVLHAAQAAGFTPYEVDDGEEGIKCDTAVDVMRVGFDVDEFTVYFQGATRNSWASFILGNGSDVVHDWSTFDGDDTFSAALQSVLDRNEAGEFA